MDRREAPVKELRPPEGNPPRAAAIDSAATAIDWLHSLSTLLMSRSRRYPRTRAAVLSYPVHPALPERAARHNRSP
jgi:hypothetical protein